MVKIFKKASTLKQAAYARRVWGAQGEDKKSIALDVGYAPSVANSVMSKIESKKGFQNAIARLAMDSSNLATQVMNELQARGFNDYSNKDLISAMNAMAGAWGTFNKGLIQAERPPEDNGKNRLKTIILQNIQKQINTPDQTVTSISPIDAAITVEELNREAEDMDF